MLGERLLKLDFLKTGYGNGEILREPDKEVIVGVADEILDEARGLYFVTGNEEEQSGFVEVIMNGVDGVSGLSRTEGRRGVLVDFSDMGDSSVDDILKESLGNERKNKGDSSKEFIFDRSSSFIETGAKKLAEEIEEGESDEPAVMLVFAGMDKLKDEDCITMYEAIRHGVGDLNTCMNEDGRLARTAAIVLSNKSFNKAVETGSDKLKINSGFKLKYLF